METAKFYYQNPNAPFPNKPNHIGIAALIIMDNSILMEYRKDCNRWALIGGALEIDESLIDCLKREVKEETSLNISSYELFGIFSDPSRIIEYPDGNIIRSITIAYIVSVENVTQMEVSDESHFLKFIDKNTLNNIDVVETHKHILNRFLTWDQKQVIVE
ncbi:NUDIX domain-containing protein [Bacillus sp. IITD106]|nr:NUDIX domain-containing protein [Bacillus sp. IITD106]